MIRRLRHLVHFGRPRLHVRRHQQVIEALARPEVADAVQHPEALIEGSDQDTKATFALSMELSRLELPDQASKAPLLTIPLGR